MKTCTQCNKDFDTAGLICIECINLNWDNNQDIDAQADAAQIHRADNVFLNSLTIITPQDAANIDIEHEAFCVNNLIYDSSGIEYPDWNEKLIAHIKDLKRKMEHFRIQEGAARRVINKKRVKEVEKLTPEERDSYIRDIEKGSKLKSDVKFEKIEKHKQSAIDKQIEKLLSLGMSEESDAVKSLRKLQK